MADIRFAFVLLALCLFGVATSVLGDDFHVAFWNVENLFDLEDDPAVVLDEEFTPQSPKRWTVERLDIKLSNLAHVIRKMNAGRGPDVLGLCEVESRKVVELLVAKLAPLGRKYEIVHQDSPSDRGIDCALVYDASVFTLVDSKFHFVDAEKTRDIIEARLRHAGADLLTSRTTFRSKTTYAQPALPKICPPAHCSTPRPRSAPPERAPMSSTTAGS
jgi:hypothetical protein